MFCEDIQDMELTDALQSLMALFVEHISMLSADITACIKSKVTDWIASQAKFIQALFAYISWESWVTYYTIFTPFPRKLRAMQRQNRVAFQELAHGKSCSVWNLYGDSPDWRNTVREVHGRFPLHDLNFIQFDNLLVNPFPIRNVIVKNQWV